MARYQDLPNREGGNAVCACGVVPDQTLCQSAALVFECAISLAGAKNKLEVFGTSCSWTVPNGVTSIVVEMWGAGSGGTGQGNCCCCSSDLPGSAGGYVSATIPVTAGQVYQICGGVGGNMGCGGNNSNGAGGTSYMTGGALSNFCAGGGCNDCGCCNETKSCMPWNACNPGACGFIGSSTYVGNVVGACGESGHRFGWRDGCRNDSISGSAPFGGGAGVWTTYNHCCRYTPYTAPSGQFPGGGGGGAHMSCCCAPCTCGGCGGAGLVRVWY